MALAQVGKEYAETGITVNALAPAAILALDMKAILVSPCIFL